MDTLAQEAVPRETRYAAPSRDSAMTDSQDDAATQACERMVERQIATRGVRDPRVLAAMRSVLREEFVPPELLHAAYEDRALHIGMGQTISQPYIVGLMTASLRVENTHRVLEVGTGTGYQTAILASLARHVYTVERLEPLADAAKKRLARLGIENVSVRTGDGSLGWIEEAPFDRIIVTAAAPAISESLTGQLVPGGRMVVPVGNEDTQRLIAVERRDDQLVETPSIAVRFVRLIGEEGFPR
jgi:protein-L-isoaspartate(D-aspartate) O-methyltransferase